MPQMDHNPFVRVRIPGLGIDKDVRASAVRPGMEVIEDRPLNPFAARPTKRLVTKDGEPLPRTVDDVDGEGPDVVAPVNVEEPAAPSTDAALASKAEEAATEKPAKRGNR